MKEFRGKVAVITGAAHGIGRELAQRCVQEQMKTVLADLDEPALIAFERELRDSGATALAQTTDVSKARDVDSLARRTIDTFGAVHLLFNNAGVGGSVRDLIGPLWERTLEEWVWILGGNLWGVIHGVRFFLPPMLSQDTECHIVNVSSGAGVIHGPMLGIYKVSKHGVVSLSETLYFQLAKSESKVTVSVACPGPVKTNIMDRRIIDGDSGSPGPKAKDLSPSDRERYEAFSEWIQHDGMSPAQASDIIFTGIRNEELYIYTHPDVKEAARMRMEDVVQGRNPSI